MRRRTKKKNYNKDNKATKKLETNSYESRYTIDAFANTLARLGFGTPNLLESTEYPITRLTQDYNLMNSLYRSHWIIRKIIDCIPEDMCKNWINITTQLEPEQLKRFDKLQRITRIKRDILQALKWGRLYGGAGAVMVIEGHENMLEEPLDYDLIMPGSFKGLIVGDRWSGLFPSSEIIESVSSPDFGMPKYYEWFLENGQSMKVHHSRVLRFTGRELPYLERYAENGWGASEIEVVFDELKKRDNTSWNIAQLVFLANLRVLQVDDLGELLAIGDERSQAEFYNKLSIQNQLMNNMGLYVMGTQDKFQNYQYTFSGLNDIYQSFMLDISGASEIPVTKLFGRSPAGLSATGESDMQNYYDLIDQKQESQLAPIFDKLLPVMFMSEFGCIPSDLDWSFNPIANQSEDELANIVDKKTNAIINVFSAGIISQKTSLKELRQMSDTTGMFTNITDEDIEKADEDTDSFGDMPQEEEMPLNFNMPSSDGIKKLFDGGKGSGNFGHEGRPGEIGGSGEGGESDKIDKKEEKKKRELEKIQNLKPPLAKRHRLESIGKHSRPNNTGNTIILPSVDYHKDIEDIKKGLYNKVNNNFEVNGRLYTYHDNIFYPVSGEGLVNLNRNQYKLLIELKVNPRNPYLDKIKHGLNLSKEEENTVYELIKILGKEK